MDIENDHTSSARLDLFGRDLGERAITEMWNRRMELEILEPIANAFRQRVPLFANRLRQVPQDAEAQRAVAEYILRGSTSSSGPPIHSWRSLLGRRHHRVLVRRRSSRSPGSPNWPPSRGAWTIFARLRFPCRRLPRGRHFVG